MKKILYLLVLAWFFPAYGGSYEDFFIAIKRDDPQVIQELLSRGFDANAPSPDGQHGLYLALREPSLKVAQVLARWPKTDVDQRNGADETPLMMASLKGHTGLVRQLVARGADVNKPGWAPLHYAATGGHVEIIGILLEQHAFIDAESPKGTTPLMMAAHYGTPAAVRALLAAGADPLMRNQLGLTAQDFAFRASRPEVAELIAAQIRATQPKGRW
jgi:ankyrin repeat protein